MRSTADTASGSAANEYPIPVVRTKLHRPPVAADLIDRSALLQGRASGDNICLILVSAPAGYGKSTLVAQWLDQHPAPSAWLSLDDADNNLRRFAIYLTACLRDALGDVCSQSLALLGANAQSDGTELAGAICNELDEVDGPFIVALDNYDRITSIEVHRFIDAILDHPPRNLRLILMTRRDPPLSLMSLRAHNNSCEIRLNDLRFTSEESLALLTQGSSGLSERLAGELNKTIEGWPVAVRLAILALAGHENPDAFVHGFQGGVQQVRDYLGTEIMANQSPAMRERLLRASVLDKFCASLCDYVWNGEQTSSAENIDETGQSFIDQLQHAGLLTISLDDRRQWFRFHHLFQEMLQRQLTETSAPESVANLHRRACAWYESNGLIEDAFQHAMKADGPASAGAFMVPHLNEIANTDRWGWVESWITMIPPSTMKQTPELLVLNAAVLHSRGFDMEAAVLIDDVEQLLVSRDQNGADFRTVRGTVDAIRAGQACFQGHPEKSLQLVQEAFELLPPQAHVIRGYALIMGAISHYMCGNLDKAHETVATALTEVQTLTGAYAYHARALLALGLLQRSVADVSDARLTGIEITLLHTQSPVPECATVGRYLEGAALYDQGELEKAIEVLAPVVNDVAMNNAQFYLLCGFTLANAYHARRSFRLAKQTVDRLAARMQHSGRKQVLPTVVAFQADLAIRQNRLAQAEKWARSYEPELKLVFEMYSPHLTFVKLLLQSDEPTDLAKASTRLDRFVFQLRNLQMIRLLIDALAIKAVLLEAQGEGDSAIAALSEALELALPSGIIRTFVDLGQPMAQMLNRARAEDEKLRFIGKILAAFRESEDRPKSTGPTMQQSDLDPLSKRELEILGLLAERLSNKEIAEQLFISLGTVKRHTANIYQKLSVEGRRAAVAKAIGIGLLENRSTS